jgi:arginine deiminase
MIGVSSEIGRLERVLVHEPGPEVDRMPPAMMEQLLFDDILYGDRARDEHGRFRRVLQLLGIEVVEAADLLATALSGSEARDWVVGLLLEELPLGDRRELLETAPEDLGRLLVAGSTPRAAPAGIEVEDLFELPPLPNWCFQRDPQVILGDGVIFSSMAAPARHREGLLSRAIFRFHPELRETPVLCDPLEDHPSFIDRERPHLEGGDVLVLSSDVIVVGLSERTNKVALRHLARALARQDGLPRWMIVVEIPRRRAYMHLDTLITPIDRDACLVHAPVILEGGYEQARVWEIDLHGEDLARVPCAPLLTRLAEHGVELEPVLCGGSDPVTQQREQWTDGANALALAPGVITLYDRNVRTAEELARHGFRVVEAENILLGREEVDLSAGERVCILISSHEISRARGGPHCLAHPLARQAA